jgi:hypothetical protein
VENRTSLRPTQQHDFSGEYVLNRQASTLSAAAARCVLSASVGIDHQEPHFRCQFTFVVDGKPFHGAFELVTDGRKVTHTERERSPCPRCSGMETLWCPRTGVRERLDSATNCSMRDIAFE